MRIYSYAAKVKAMREERAWTQEQLAAVSGVSVRTIQRIERGAPASFESLKAIATAFNVDVSELHDAAASLYVSQEYSPVLSTSAEYIHTDTQRLESWLTDLKYKHYLAEQEAQHARTLHLDLEGPRRAAEAAVERLSTQFDHVARLIERVRAGYEYWGDKREFDVTAAEAFGWCSWQELSDVLAPGTLLGHDDADIRLPVSVQDRYAQAISTRLFDGFEICACFEPSDFEPSEINEEPQGPITHYLFGTIQSVISKAEPIFLIASWEER